MNLKAKEEEIDNFKRYHSEEIKCLTVKLVEKYTEEIDKSKLEFQKKDEDYEKQLSSRNDDIASVNILRILFYMIKLPSLIH
jgi:hypothetical protein